MGYYIRWKFMLSIFCEDFESMEAVERKKKFIIDVVYIALVLVLFYFFMKYAFGLFFPFLCALLVAYALQKPVNFICNKTPLKRGPISVALVLFSVTVVLGIIIALFVRLGIEVKSFFSYILVELQDLHGLVKNFEVFVSSHLSFLPDKLEGAITSFLSEKVSSFLESTTGTGSESASFDFSMLKTPLTSVWNTAKQIPTTLVAIVIAVVACCFMTSDFKTVREVILSLFKPKTREKIITSKNLLFPALSKMAKAYTLIIAITFTELCLGLFLMKLIGIYEGTYIFIFAFITAIIDIIPILGTGTVLVPWAIYTLINGNVSLAIGIIIMYVCITVIRQVIEPKLVADQLGIPPFATIIAMYVGSQIFGVLGIFLLPITLVMVKLLNEKGIIHIFHPLEETKKSPESIQEAPKK